jgi:serine/threonine protein kinase
MFNLQRLIGHGAQAAVFSVCRLSDRAPFALRLAAHHNPDSIPNDWQSEHIGAVRLCALAYEHGAKLSNVLLPYAIGTTFSGLSCILSELCETNLQDLRGKCQTTTILNEKCGSNRWIMYQLLNAVKELHELGVIHRDIKPSNIMVSSSGHVMLGDLGALRILSNGASTPPPPAAMMSEHTTTVCYRPPELFSPKRPVIRPFAIDAFSLGVIMYENLFNYSNPFLMRSVDRASAEEDWREFVAIRKREFSTPRTVTAQHVWNAVAQTGVSAEITRAAATAATSSPPAAVTVDGTGALAPASRSNITGAYRSLLTVAEDAIAQQECDTTLKLMDVNSKRTPDEVFSLFAVRRMFSALKGPKNANHPVWLTAYGDMCWLGILECDEFHTNMKTLLANDADEHEILTGLLDPVNETRWDVSKALAHRYFDPIRKDLASGVLKLPVRS